MEASARVGGGDDVDLPPETFTDQAAYIRAVRTGIPGEVVRQAIAALGGQRELFVRLLDTTSANLSRYYRKKKLSRSDTEAVLDTLRVYRQATTVFGDVALAREWLSSSVTALAGERPIELFDTFEGRRWVRDVLRKIEYGEFS